MSKHRARKIIRFLFGRKAWRFVQKNIIRPYKIFLFCGMIVVTEKQNLAFKRYMKRKSNIRRRQKYGIQGKVYRGLLRHKSYLANTLDYRCQICRERFPWEELSIDHIIPLSKGGTHDRFNLQLACKRCNAKKGSKIYKTGHNDMMYAIDKIFDQEK